MTDKEKPVTVEALITLRKLEMRKFLCAKITGELVRFVNKHMTLQAKERCSFVTVSMTYSGAYNYILKEDDHCSLLIDGWLRENTGNQEVLVSNLFSDVFAALFKIYSDEGYDTTITLCGYDTKLTIECGL
jgi:hypothetical protein